VLGVADVARARKLIAFLTMLASTLSVALAGNGSVAAELSPYSA
jgi:hypothetical protein